MMLTYEEALPHARQHLWSLRPPLDWVWKLPVGKRVGLGWFFHYILEPARLIHDGKDARFGGPSGFIVCDDITIRVVAHWETELLTKGAPDGGNTA
jgi:hypothetical protein